MQGQGQVLKFDPSGVLRTRINITVFYPFIWLFVLICLFFYDAVCGFLRHHTIYT